MTGLYKLNKLKLNSTNGQQLLLFYEYLLIKTFIVLRNYYLSFTQSGRCEAIMEMLRPCVCPYVLSSTQLNVLCLNLVLDFYINRRKVK
jgi:hypothetical protein